MTDPVPLADRLAQLAPPANAEGSPALLRAHYDLLARRLGGQLDLIDAWRQRLPRLPEPPARQSLQELVQAARRAVREERSRADLTELQLRLGLVDRIRNLLV
jgi:hypothetical protein